jgi:hypothetical protein
MGRRISATKRLERLSALPLPVPLAGEGRGEGAASRGLTLTYAPEDVIQPHVEAGRLVRVLEAWSPTFPGYRLYYRAAASLCPPSHSWSRRSSCGTERRGTVLLAERLARWLSASVVVA